jgi:biotin operon repressor
MDKLILLKATGTPEEFAGKLGIRRSTLFQALQEMRVLGVDIKYSCELRTYYYAGNRRIKINIESILSEEEILEVIR